MEDGDGIYAGVGCIIIMLGFAFAVLILAVTFWVLKGAL